MDFIREYWWLLLLAAIAIAVAVTLLRPRQSVRLTDSAPIRPHMTQRAPAHDRGLAGEATVAAAEFVDAPLHRKVAGAPPPGDDLTRMKGVGPKFAEALNRIGFHRFDQLAHLTPNEIDRVDAQLGAFSGRITRDRVVEQADYLARGDLDGFEQRFGKL
jgi:predicted flap endonuclease-1-like 5' DNA nuclease